MVETCSKFLRAKSGRVTVSGYLSARTLRILVAANGGRSMRDASSSFSDSDHSQIGSRKLAAVHLYCASTVCFVIIDMPFVFQDYEIASVFSSSARFGRDYLCWHFERVT